MALWSPLDASNGTPLGAPDTLEVTNEAAAFGATTNDYFIKHLAGGPGVGQPEQEAPGTHTNDSAATAEPPSVLPANAWGPRWTRWNWPTRRSSRWRSWQVAFVA